MRHLQDTADTINVHINEDNSITVVDNGRGIPVGYQPQSREIRQ